jgi:hypothetical protein
LNNLRNFQTLFARAPALRASPYVALNKQTFDTSPFSVPSAGNKFPRPALLTILHAIVTSGVATGAPANTDVGEQAPIAAM